MIQEVINKAISAGACAKMASTANIGELVDLFFSPQGIEFCSKNNFPDLSTFRGLKNELSEFCIFVDSKQIKSANNEFIALVGDTQGELIFDENKHVNTVVLMHGARAVIRASNYAVLNIANISCEAEVIKDETVIVL